MVYLQLMMGLGVGILGLGLAYFVMNRQGFHAYGSSSSSNDNNTYGSNSWGTYDSEEVYNSREQRRHCKARPGDRCPICLESLLESDMRYLICEHALHRLCYEDYRNIRVDCPICTTKCFKLNSVGDDCVICFEPMGSDNMQYMQCEHALHKVCLLSYKQMGNRNCPLCRKNI